MTAASAQDTILALFRAIGLAKAPLRGLNGISRLCREWPIAIRSFSDKRLNAIANVLPDRHVVLQRLYLLISGAYYVGKLISQLGAALFDDTHDIYPWAPLNFI